jgi:hypothetical protein
VEADDSLELGPPAPALELPWNDPTGRSHYVELRGEAGATERNLDQIAEVRQFPALRRFLLDVNSPPSPWQTAKCDVWTGQAEPAENLYNAGFTHGSYIDLVLAEQASSWRGSLEVHQRLAKQLARRLEANESIEAVAEIVVRRCYFHRDCSPEESDAGYCLTLFLLCYGASPGEAAHCWDLTLEWTAQCLVKSQAGEEGAQKSEVG